MSGRIVVRRYMRRTKKGVTQVKSHSKKAPVINPRERKLFKYMSSHKNFENEYGGAIDFDKKGQIENINVMPGKKKEIALPDYEVLYHTHPSKMISLPTPEDVVSLVKNKNQQAEIVFRNGKAFIITKTQDTNKLKRAPINKLYKKIDKIWVDADKKNDESRFKKGLEKEGFIVQINNDTQKPIKLNNIKVMQ
jgi:hypothetical protein